MTTFTQGDRVTYIDRSRQLAEEGVVVRTGSDGSVVFVLFDGDTTAKACRQQDLVHNNN